MYDNIIDEFLMDSWHQQLEHINALLVDHLLYYVRQNRYVKQFRVRVCTTRSDFNRFNAAVGFSLSLAKTDNKQMVNKNGR